MTNLSRRAVGLIVGGLLIAYPSAVPLAATGDEVGYPVLAGEQAVEIRLAADSPSAAVLAAAGPTMLVEVSVEDGILVLRVPDLATAARLLNHAVSDGTGRQYAGLPWVRVELANADARHVRAEMGSQLVVAQDPVEVSCSLEPPAILLRGESWAVAKWAALAKSLDIAPDPVSGPEDVVRSYLERWLVVPEGRSAADFEGMYELTTLAARRQITLPEFAMLISKTTVAPRGPVPLNQLAVGVPGAPAPQTPTTASSNTQQLPPNLMLPSGLCGEIAGVYPAEYNSNRTVAAVGYSVAWFPIEGQPRLSAAMPQGLAPGGWRAQPLAEDAVPSSTGTLSVAQSQAISVQSVRPGRMAFALHRGQALVVQDTDGKWRLPMLFDPKTRTWLTPLSPTLVERLFPERPAAEAG